MKEITPENKGIQQISPSPRSQTVPGQNPGLTGEFSRILSQHLEPATPEPAAPSGGLPELFAPYAVHLAHTSLSDNGVAGQISETIDLLDDYAQGLADPATTLKQAFDLLEQIGSQTQTIDQNMADTQNEDPRLKDIMAHLSTLVELEKIKINRGDYS